MFPRICIPQPRSKERGFTLRPEHNAQKDPIDDQDRPIDGDHRHLKAVLPTINSKTRPIQQRRVSDLNIEGKRVLFLHHQPRGGQQAM